MKPHCIAFVSLLLFGLSGCVAESEELPGREASLQALMETEVFAGARVGYAGAVPEQAYAFNSLLEEQDAAELFSAILQEGQLAGRLYALCGLYLVDRGTFDEVIDEYLSSQEEVSTFMGCIMSTQPVSVIATDIQTGEWPMALDECL